MIAPETAALAIIRVGLDPVAFGVGSFSLHWYGITYAVAFAVAYRAAAAPHLVRRGVDRGAVTRVFTTAVITGLIGARLGYVLQSDTLYYLENPLHILALWEGGMAFVGALIASSLSIAVMSRRQGISPWLLLDAGALSAAVGQPLGRLGNLIDGDILGAPSTLPWATAYTNPHAVLQSGFALCTQVHCTAYQPVAAYEAMGTLVILAVLLAMRRAGARPGLLAVGYVALYGLGELLIPFWRVHMPQHAGLAVAQWSGIVATAVVAPALLLRWRRSAAARGEPLPTGPVASPHPDRAAA